MADTDYGWTTLGRLEAFHAAYRRRNLTVAARDLGFGRVRPNRGRVWQLLEELAVDLYGDSGQKLFQRIEAGGRAKAGQTLTPTPAADKIEPLIAALIAHVADLKATATGTSGRLRVACFPAHVHEFLAELMSRAPDLLDLHEVDDAYRPEGGIGLFKLLKSAAVDVIVAPAAAHDEFEQLPIYEWQLTAVGTDRWLPSSTRQISADALVDVPLLLSPHGHNSRRLVEAAFARIKKPPLVLHQSRSTESLMSMVDAELGLAILPSDAVWHVPKRNFAVFGGNNEHLGRHALYWRRGGEHDQRLTELLNSAHELVAERGLEPRIGLQRRRSPRAPAGSTPRPQRTKE